ncbi:hypothetical protein HGH93_21445 [Chitinophaga polysaccharea]|uniref:hypothetical protein n=1 Tax=Chitinophaga polysaccharea TaxID=1293035 RepID=UPI001455BACB|nr:hypothetical protein [Chitinophaga polysaccharea]NLR60689.1 hypothetical protein [Chitinophaga polysaccharea]
MDFSLTTMFVLPPNNLYPSTGSTESLLAKQFGIYGANYALYTTADEPYIYLAQGRFENIDNTGSKRSAKIAKSKLVSFYKVSAEQNTRNQRTILSNFKIKCGEEMVITIRAHSNYIDAGFANGYTHSVVVPAPCCDCGSDPCSEVDPVDVGKMLDDAVQKFSESGPFMGSVLSNYITVSRAGGGGPAATQLVIEGKPLKKDGRIADISANPWEYDRLWYSVFVTKAADTTQDYMTYDRCEQIATITTTPQYGYVRGSSDEIFHMEKYYYSYQTPHFKDLMCNESWNGAFESYVVDGQFYDTYYIKFLSYDDNYTFDNALPQDQTVIVAIPAGQGVQFEEIMTLYLGPFKNYSGVPVTISSTTTTSTTII